jgi:aminoglycoside phosphotransferase (APT) family kinase protein
MIALDVERTQAGRAATSTSVPLLWDFVDESGLRPVVVGVSKDPNAKVTLLLVSTASGRPKLVVKIPTSAVAAAAVAAEREMLDWFADRLPASLRSTVPEAVGSLGVRGRWALVTTAVQGTPMTVSYLGHRHTADARKVAHDLRAAGTWLAELQRTTAGANAPIDLVAAPAHRLRLRFGPSELTERVLDLLAGLDSRLAAASTPRTAVHGDFWFGNLLQQDGAVSGVVDWEDGAPSGEPLRDLVRFALTYALYLDRRTRPGRGVVGHPGLCATGFGAGVEFALNGRGWFPEQFRGFLERGLTRLGAPAALWRPAALAGIAELAAQSDDESFARKHLALIHRIAGSGPQRRTS